MNLPFWVAIPVVALLIPIAAIIADAYKSVHMREHQHRERMKAIETGMLEPAALLTAPAEAPAKKTKSKSRRGAAFHGAVWTGLGGGLLVSTVAMHHITDSQDLAQFADFLLVWAIPALFVGIALVIYAAATRNGNGNGASSED